MANGPSEFTAVELCAQRSLREHAAEIDSHARLWSLGRALMASVGGDLTSEAAESLIEKYYRVLFVGAPEELHKLAYGLRESGHPVDPDIVWLSATAEAVTRAMTAAPQRRGVPKCIELALVDAETDPAVLSALQLLQRRNGLVPLPNEFLTDVSRIMSYYAIDDKGEVIGSSSCARMNVESVFPWRSALAQNTCVREDYRRAGLARALKHAAIAAALECFEPIYVAVLVRPWNIASHKMNGEFGLLPDDSVSALMVERQG